MRTQSRFSAVSLLVILMSTWPGTLSSIEAQDAVKVKEQTDQREEERKMEETIIHADLFARKLKGLSAELYVNDVPVARVGGQLQPWASVAVPEFLVDGKNTLSVVLGAGETPATAKAGVKDRQSEPGMEIWARIVRMKDGEMAQPGSGETLLEITWVCDSPESLPKTLSTSGDVGTKFGLWKWQSAETLTLDSATTASATDFITRIAKAYTSGKPDPIIEAAKYKHEEAVRAYPVYPEGSFDAMFKEQLATMSQQPNWKPYELPHDQYDLRLVADGRMIEAIAKDWRPIIRVENGDYGYHLYLGKVDGQWQILR
jgi:hypothetical protein